MFPGLQWVVVVGGGLVALQTIVYDRAEPVEVVVGVGDRDAVRVGGMDGFHFATRKISIAQFAYIRLKEKPAG